ncbi:hypothetical protein MSAN_00401300 [Mycena sanguinolenta]|uniref:Uncharacterized protein n=1 Tax=Mycena sanguinolenta TaxID=230812 RepID=A0A8H7DK05_9AGAR|nr:hypothetical protein MSAN_00401300 [Mycena sanguinolenta]
MNGKRPTHPPDFKVALRGLSSSIENAMIAWHNVQTAPLKANSSFLARHFFTPFRGSLHLHWMAIGVYLQQCHNFSQDAVAWDDSEPESSASWLEDLATYSDEICLKNEDLVRQSDQGMEYLSSLAPQLSELLQSSTKSTAASPATYSFLGMSSPDGVAAIASTSVALAEIRACLHTLHQFWLAVSETCRSFQKSSGITTADEMRKLGDTWKDYQEEILVAKVSISKSLDAVATEPSTFRRQQRRRGSSKSEMSISSSPRKMSSLDEDHVPKSCWGFAGVFGRKR